PEPARVAGDAVQEDDHRPRGRPSLQPAQAVQPDAVAGRQEPALGTPAGTGTRSVERTETVPAPSAGGWVAHDLSVDRLPPGVNGTIRARGCGRPQPAASRTTVRWVPRSSAPSWVAIDAVITSPALRCAWLRCWGEKKPLHLSGVGSNCPSFSTTAGGARRAVPPGVPVRNRSPGSSGWNPGSGGGPAAG